ncbi:MAG: YgiQ family radical SAM protein [Thermoguttaceae bacterium]|nr:YgiQ family radical SAM protein [Thermoguttaceae bacterium]
MSETIQLSDLFNDSNRSARPELQTPAPLPMTPEEVAERGWEDIDVVFITGDAYVDSPSFANGLLARVLEKDGFKVAILSQPDWSSADDFQKFGCPRLAFCISAGNMDSMINHYTANRKVRNDDAYSPGGKIGRRPDRATLAYCQRAREAFPGVPIIAGGIEASLRRIAHYDYWSDKVRRSIVLDAKIDLLVYGMGERAMLEILRRLNAGETIKDIRDVRGTVYKLGKTEDLPEESDVVVHLPSFDEVEESRDPIQLAKLARQKKDPELKKQADEARNARLLFVEMTKIAFDNINPYCAKTLVQEHGEEAIVVNPPSFPLSESDMDVLYALPFTRKAHPSYTEPIPAVEIVRSSIQTHRGCFGGCSFCAITAHQGKFIQSRSESAILSEIGDLAKNAGGNYVVSDLNAPTANMYQMRGKNQDVCKQCKRASCLCPEICTNLDVDHSAYLKLLRNARNLEGVKSVLIASGIRTDLANFSPEFVEELAAHHTGGHLKTAPEHVNDNILRLMNKPPIANYEQFCDLYMETSRRLGKEQYLVPYLIAGFPGCTLRDMVEVAEYLKKNDIRPEQVQDFIPAPFQLATCAYYTGIDPVSSEQVYVPKGLRERRLQHALLLYYNPAFYHDVKSALKEAGREDLIGNGEDALIPPYPSKDAALRRSSRIKRLIRQSQKEAREKEEFRSRFADLEETKQSSGKRVGRDRADSSGGYRSGAREFGTGSRYVGSKVWDPIDKRWKRAENAEKPEDRNERDAKREPRRDGDVSDKSRRPRSNHRRFDDSSSKGGWSHERRSESRSFVKREGEYDSFRRRSGAEGEDFKKGRFDDRREDERSSSDRRSGRFDGKNTTSSRFSKNRKNFSSSRGDAESFDYRSEPRTNRRNDAQDQSDKRTFRRNFRDSEQENREDRGRRQRFESRDGASSNETAKQNRGFGKGQGSNLRGPSKFRGNKPSGGKPGGGFKRRDG